MCFGREQHCGFFPSCISWEIARGESLSVGARFSGGFQGHGIAPGFDLVKERIVGSYEETGTKKGIIDESATSRSSQ